MHLAHTGALSISIKINFHPINRKSDPENLQQYALIYCLIPALHNKSENISEKTLYDSTLERVTNGNLAKSLIHAKCKNEILASTVKKNMRIDIA